jgi:hypothetical protein
VSHEREGTNNKGSYEEVARGTIAKSHRSKLIRATMRLLGTGNDFHRAHFIPKRVRVNNFHRHGF